MSVVCADATVSLVDRALSAAAPNGAGIRRSRRGPGLSHHLRWLNLEASLLLRCRRRGLSVALNVAPFMVLVRGLPWPRRGTNEDTEA